MNKLEKSKTARLHEPTGEVFVGWDVAKLAADSGFDLWCEASWTHYKKTSKVGGYKKDTYRFELGGIMHGSNTYHRQLSGEYYEIVSAPAQSVLQKWLRDVKNKNIFVLPNRYDGDQWYYVVGLDIISKEESGLKYEHALELGLLYTLQEINNGKNDRRT